MSSAQNDASFDNLSDFLSSGELNSLNEVIDHEVSLPEFISDLEFLLDPVSQTGIQVHTGPYCGEYNFRIAVESSSRRSYEYSAQLNRLYIDMNKVAPIKFMWNGPDNFHVRAMLIYKEPDFEKIAVSRCRMHEDKADSSNTGYSYPQHVLRCDDERSLYTENMSSSRRSVITFLQAIPQGDDGVIVHYRLMCKTSCVGGINRRMTDIIFTLEDCNNRVVGRAVLGVKICSSPRRDKAKDEAPTSKKRRSDATPVLNRVPAKVMKSEVDPDYVTYQVRVPETKSGEFQTLFSRWLAGAVLPEETVQQTTYGSIVRL